MNKSDVLVCGIPRIRGNTLLSFFVTSLGAWVSVEVVINISFGLEVILCGSLFKLSEVLMNNLNIIINTMVCVWCEVAFLRNLSGDSFNPVRDRWLWKL